MTANPMSENVARDVAGAGELMHHIANQKYVSDKAPKKKILGNLMRGPMMFFTSNIC